MENRILGTLCDPTNNPLAIVRKKAGILVSGLVDLQWLRGADLN
jgi:hypothetical protein